jgi:hypothetical protein
MSEANVEIIRRHYEREAEAFRGGNVRAFLEEFRYDQGVLEAGEEEGAFVEGGWHGRDGVTAFLEIAGPEVLRAASSDEDGRIARPARLHRWTEPPPRPRPRTAGGLQGARRRRPPLALRTARLLR